MTISSGGKIVKKLKFSIIIPFREPTPYLYECLEHIKKQTYQNYEVILLPDEKEIFNYPNVFVIATGKTGPAEKRDLGAERAKGDILAFIDDDAYPDGDWLKNSLKYYTDPKIAAVCGPGVTPSADDIFQKASGFVNSLKFGSGGAGTYRFIPAKRRWVDDYPSMNFLIRKDDFVKLGGFDTYFWPGEDTKLCLDLVYKQKKKIIYDPQVLVFHHRKPLFLPHLTQISRYALHRGHFARILPATSLRIGYLMPTLFVGFLSLGLLISVFFAPFQRVYFSTMLVYFFILTANVIYITFKSKSILVAWLTGCGIVLTHVIYGLVFPIGFFKKNLKQ